MTTRIWLALGFVACLVACGKHGGNNTDSGGSSADASSPCGVFGAPCAGGARLLLGDLRFHGELRRKPGNVLDRGQLLHREHRLLLGQLHQQRVLEHAVHRR